MINSLNSNSLIVAFNLFSYLVNIQKKLIYFVLLIKYMSKTLLIIKKKKNLYSNNNISTLLIKKFEFSLKNSIL